MTETIKEIRLHNKLTTADVTQGEYIKRMVYRLNNECREPSAKDKRELRKQALKREINDMLK